MLIRVGCEFKYESEFPTPAVVQVEPRQPGPHHVVTDEWVTTPDVPSYTYYDLYGNTCRRLVIPPGEWSLRYDATVEVPNTPDEVDLNAARVPIEDLPDETLVYTLPSRYCLSDQLSDRAWELFGGIEGGWATVQAICDWVHGNITFGYGSSTPLTTAADVFESRMGVCRDFAHLAVTLCRAVNIPARYTFGYLPDIDVLPPFDPMDFCAWMEVYLGGRWWTFDPRNNKRRIGRALIGRGRDALDVAMMTTYGSAILKEMVVWADEVTTEVSP